MPEIMNNILKDNEILTRPTIPSIVTWDRLEPRPRKKDFDRSLRVEIRDALWMLTRQWQFGEFKGEDAGSAIEAKVLLETSRINRYSMKGGKAVACNDTLPLETKVERETIPFDLSLRMQMGRQWLKMLRSAISTDYKSQYLTKYPIEYPADQAEKEKLFSDRTAWQTLEAAKGRVIDGASLFQAIHSGDHATWVTNTNTIAGPDKPIVLITATAFLEWLKRIYSQPDKTDDSAWAPSYLEYQFTCSAPEHNNKQTVLVAEQYHRGHLDWYSFDLDKSPGANLEDKPGQVITDPDPEEHLISFIPSPIEFGGMPNVRWWEMEDRRTDFGDINASTTDVAKLLLTEFGLIYGNDWSIIPFDLEPGSLTDIKGIIVTDVFGQRTLIRAAGRGPDDDWQRWNMYNLSTKDETGEADNRLFLPPTIGKMLEGDPIEEVNFMRDEMANMVWAVEYKIPGVLGKGINGYEATVELTNYFSQNAPSPTTPSEIEETDAVIKYGLGTSVPENWIPLIPVHVSGSNRAIQLQRATMPRLIEGTSSSVVLPRSVVLQHGISEGKSYFIHEEEIPRAGAIVRRSFQRTRWWNGRIYTWIGRRKQTGRGEGSSGLKFDQIIPSKDNQ